MRILKGKPGFVYGNCAPCAIGQAFGIKLKVVEEVFRLIKIEPSKGITTIQCRRVIKALCRANEKEAKYTPFRYISLKEFAKKHPKGIFLINFPRHLAYYKNGAFIDSYLENLTNYERAQSQIMGAWEIVDKPQSQIVHHLTIPDHWYRSISYYSTTVSTY